MALSGNMVDELEASFQNCMALLTNMEHFNVATDADEIRTSTDQSIQRFLDAARQLDCFFMQKSLLFNAQKPDTSGKEDVVELKAELERKNTLLMKHYERLQNWQAILNRNPSSASTSSTSSPSTGTATSSAGAPPPGAAAQSAGTVQSGSSQQPSTRVATQSQPPSSFMTSQNPLMHLEQTASNVGLAGRPGGGAN